MVKDKRQFEDPVVIPLGNNLIAWISKEDAEIASWGWSRRIHPNGTAYAACQIHIAGTTSETIYLHNQVWENMSGAPVPKGYLVDHINRDKLDCRRCNLRLATRSQNEANKRKRVRTKKPTSSKYKGVNFISYGKNRTKKWRAAITRDRKQITIGTYETEIEAAKAYNEVALQVYGEHAFLNEIEEENNNE